MTGYDFLVAAASFVAGVIASLAGFGIGSIVTPLLAIRLGMKVAVAAVAIPHVVATAIRFWFMRKQLDRQVLLTFGVASAAGGLAGALLHSFLGGRILTYILAALLLFAGLTGLLGINIRFGRRGAWAAGAVSGMLGGVVGNQGGIRAGAMLAFDVKKEAFIATATAVGLIVDMARLPVYLANERDAVFAAWPLVAIATAGAVAGTYAGWALLGRFDDKTFRRVVSLLLIGLGVWLLVA